jgi:S-formylglutathione hydrolase FrmB
MRPLVVGLVALMLSGVAVPHARAQARTVRMPADGGQRIFAILLPRSYADSDGRSERTGPTSDRRYPVVYLFHGGGQDHTAFMARTSFAPMARRHEVIVVMPAADRNYSAQAPDLQARYHDFVARDLVEYVDTNYRTIAMREGRAIGGISMGGRIATMTALRHPDRFGAAGAFSAALRPDVEDAVRAAGGGSPFFYVSCGTLDGLLEANRRFAARLVERGVPHEYREIGGVGHVWDLWDQQIAVFFSLLDSRRRSP